MKHSKIIILFFFILFTLLRFSVSAQNNFLLKGKLIDTETKELLPFASIGIEGTSIGTASNAFGYFEFRLNSNWKDKFIICSFVGYQPFKIKVSELYQHTPKK